MLTAEQMAKVAAREARAGECVYLDVGPAAKIRRYLAKSIRVIEEDNGALCVDLAFLTARKICNRGDLIHSSHSKSKAPCDFSSVPNCAAKRIVVVMPHTAKGNANIVEHRRRQEDGEEPLRRCRVITDLAIMDITEAGMILRELAPNVSAREVQEATATPLLSEPGLGEMVIP